MVRLAIQEVSKNGNLSKNVQLCNHCNIPIIYANIFFSRLYFEACAHTKFRIPILKRAQRFEKNLPPCFDLSK